MQDLLNKGISAAKEKTQQLGQGVSTGAGKAVDYLKANPTVAAMLLAGGGAGLLGGYMSSQQKTYDAESKAERRKRILRNALLSAGAGAGAVGLGAAGLKTLSEAVPADSKNPVEEKLTSWKTRALGAAGAGALGLSKGHSFDLQDYKQQALRHLSKEEFSALKDADPAALKSYVEKNKKVNIQPSNGIAAQIDRVKSPHLKRLLGVLVGKTRAGQAARGAAGLGLMLPEALGQAKDLILEN